MARRLLAVSILPLLVLSLTLGLASRANAEEGSQSLYDRLGGIYNIALVVDDFIDQVGANDILNANPQVYAHREPLRFPGLKFQLTAMVCQATGGPCNYIGKSMLETHDGWMITDTRRVERISS